jgi:hypothetical protein
VEKSSCSLASAGGRLPLRILVIVPKERSLLLLLRLLHKEVENIDFIAKVNTVVVTVVSYAVHMNTQSRVINLAVHEPPVASY